MITWHEACRQQTVKNSGVRKIEDYEYSSGNIIWMTPNYILLTCAE